ncbi:hypothetical protein, partial [Shewanella chilikensis]|uniref:hypothetical protein n=1 Tax=Shewanella chilikensis TaxID=558541 RepID=UPI001F23F744
MLYSYLSNFSDSKIFDKITTLMNTDNIIPSLILKEYINLIKEDAFQNVINEVLNEILINENFSPLWISSSEFPIIATKNSVLSLRYNDENNEQESIYG